jgi:hypothetical protein
VAVPRFSYELAPPRKDRYVVSVLLHIAFFLVIWRLGPLLPGPEFENRHSNLTIIYEPPPPLELKPPAPVQKIPPPPKWVVSMHQPRLVTPPEPKVEPPKLEVKPALAEMKAPVVRPKLEQHVVTGIFSKPADTAKPVDNKKDVVTNAFAQGTSEPATLHKPAAQVQTGGFGDPNGIRGIARGHRHSDQRRLRRYRRRRLREPRAPGNRLAGRFRSDDYGRSRGQGAHRGKVQHQTGGDSF